MTEYYRNTRHDIVALLPRLRGARVLEVGCGEGVTGAKLKEQGIAREVVGIELIESAARAASRRLDQVFTANVEKFDAWESLGSFELIICADVLEHLVDPWDITARLSALLVMGGYFVTSTPNIRYWKIIADLAWRGRWEYEDAGILDRTHLRFFTQQSIAQLHTQAGLSVVKLSHGELSGKRAVVDRLVRGRARDLLSGQHLVLSQRG